jgi:hypothetical protein
MTTTIKLCECGCGQPAPIATQNHTRLRYVKGEPLRFIKGHNPHRVAAKTHGLSKTPEYDAFMAAKRRCTNPNHQSYKDYGGRGIKFLFDSLQQFLDEIGLRPEGMELDRIDNDGNYQPGNVRWATPSTNKANRRWTPARQASIDKLTEMRIQNALSKTA